MTRPRILLALLLAATAAAAQPLTLSLAPPAEAVAAGSDAAIELLILNRSPRPEIFETPATLAALLTLGERSWPVQLRAAPDGPAAAVNLAPGAFAARRYLVALPPGVAGRAVIEANLAGLAPARGVIDLSPTSEVTPTLAPAAAPPTTDAEKKPITNLAHAEPAAAAIQRAFADHLSAHEPIYFIAGGDAPAAKFQFSLKYRLFNFTELSREHMARTLQVAFTQRSLWDIQGESSPFYDTSYMPELIYESLTPKPEAKDTDFTWLGFQVALKHESNGREGAASRSLNTVYFRSAFAFGDLTGWHLIVLPEFWTYITPLDNNPYLKDYRGYGQLRLVLGRNDGPSLMVSAWTGREFDRPTFQCDLSLPVRTKLLNFETYFLVQYFNGYGESLLSYRERSATVRAGLSLIR